MRAKPIRVTLVLLLVIIGVFAYHWEARRPASCQICARDIPKQTEFHMETAQGTIRACCPACALHYLLHHDGSTRQMLATDFGSGRMIPAATAYYDEGGNVQYCTAHQPPVERGPQGVRTRVYDRCLPTLVAFATRDEAETYRKQHGGRILTYDEAVESVRSQQGPT